MCALVSVWFGDGGACGDVVGLWCLEKALERDYFMTGGFCSVQCGLTAC